MLFLDEATSGLDPATAQAFDGLVRSRVANLRITLLLVTHDPDTPLTVVDRMIVLAAGGVRADDEWMRTYFAVRTMGTDVPRAR